MKAIKRIALAVLCIIAFSGSETYAVNAPVTEEKVESKETKEIIEINNRLKEIDKKINEAVNTINELKLDKKEQFDRDKVSTIEYDIKLLELRKEWEKEKYEIRLKRDSVSDELKNHLWKVRLLGGLIGLSSLGGFFSIYFKLKKITEEKIKKEYAEVIEKKLKEAFELVETDIEKLVEKCTEERYFIDNYKICVVSNSESDESEQFIRKIMNEYNANFATIEGGLSKEELQNFDLIILNDGLTEKGVAKDFMEKFDEKYTFTRDKYYFYLGSGLFRNIDGMSCGFSQEKISFANAKSQFYGNLLNLMRTKRKLEDNRSEVIS